MNKGPASFVFVCENYFNGPSWQIVFSSHRVRYLAKSSLTGRQFSDLLCEFVAILATRYINFSYKEFINTV